jgi:hypothetical protein
MSFGAIEAEKQVAIFALQLGKVSSDEDVGFPS